MLNDPQPITYNGTAFSMAKTTAGPTTNVFTSPGGSLTFTTKQNSTAARFRREIRMSHNMIAADPLSGTNRAIGASVYLVIDEPRSGYTDADLLHLKNALVTWATDANVTRVLTGEY